MDFVASVVDSQLVDSQQRCVNTLKLGTTVDEVCASRSIIQEP